MPRCVRRRSSHLRSLHDLPSHFVPRPLRRGYVRTLRHVNRSFLPRRLYRFVHDLRSLPRPYRLLPRFLFLPWPSCGLYDWCRPLFRLRQRLPSLRALRTAAGLACRKCRSWTRAWGTLLLVVETTVLLLAVECRTYHGGEPGPSGCRVLSSSS